MLKNILLSFLLAFGTLNGLAAKQTPQDPIAISQTDMNRLIQETRESVKKSSLNNPEVMKNFDEILNGWETYYLEEKREASYLQVLLEAFTFSALKHQQENTKGKNSNPSILHAIRTVQVLWNEGNVREVNPLIVALLHDILDNSPTMPEEIEEIFGPSITRLTEEYEEIALDGKHSEEKELALERLSRVSLEVKLVKLADRIDLVRSTANNSSLAWQNSRLQKFTWDLRLVHALKGTNPTLELILEEAYINQLDSKPSN